MQCWCHTTLYAVLATYLFCIMHFNISLWSISRTLHSFEQLHRVPYQF